MSQIQKKVEVIKEKFSMFIRLRNKHSPHAYLKR